MKNLIIALFCITYAIPAISADDDCRDFCDVMARAGEVIMNAHQKGYPMQRMIRTYSGAGDAIDELIIVAYDSPRYSIEESQQRVIEEYRDKVYLECVNVYKTNPPRRVAMPYSP